MPTAKEAYETLRAVVEAGNLSIPVRWKYENDDSNGDVPLPDTPAPFIYGDWIVESVDLVAFGGGRFHNTYRNKACLYLWVFVPNGWGLIPSLDYAEQAAVLLRSYRDEVVSCTAAWVVAGGEGSALQPPGLRASEVNNYSYSFVETEMWFDQIG
jgi:hypothetical protein